MLKILIVEDEPDLCESIAEVLRDEGYDVDCATDGAAAIAAATATVYDVVLTDVRLPKVDGLTLVRRLREESPTTDIILMTGDANVSDAVGVLKEGAFDYLTKPLQMDELVIQMARISSYRSLQRDVIEARAKLTAESPVRTLLIGHSPEIERLIKRIESVAQSDASVVITGESGTGKELVARALHEGGARRGKPFVAINCAAFPDTLIEAELFGHERGAFTGATHRRVGRFKAAHGGTLFLDEVAELSQAAQAKLLRVLQEGTVEPLGSNESLAIDVRVISATHADLRRRIADGQFREDLYYRINTIDLAIPPLRNRAGDLALLANLFMRRFARPGKPNGGISWRAWNALATYAFPGNVRELMHTIEHAVLLSRGGKIDLEHLPVTITDGGARQAAGPVGQLAPLAVAIKEFERACLIRALADSGGRKSRAAAQLGISRKSLWEKLRMHAIGDRDGSAADAASL